MAPLLTVVEYTERGAGVVAQTGLLVRTKLLNMRPRKRGRFGRALLLLIFGAVLCMGAFKGASSGTRFLLTIDPDNPQFGFVITRRLLELGLMFLFTVLGVSSLISSLTGFYLARDLQLLNATPVRPAAFYFARLLEVAFQSSWIMVPLIIPMFWGVGVGLHAPVVYFLSVPFAVLGLVMPICAMSVMLVTAVSCVVPASRVREFFMVASGFLFVGVYLLVRAARPEQFIYPEKFRSIPALLEELGVANSYLPSAWASDVLLWSSGRSLEQGPRALVCMLVLLFVTLGLGLMVHKMFYARARSRATEIKSTPTKRAEWLVASFVFVGRLLGRKGLDRAMMEKEAKLVLRDPQQWTQIMMLFALLILFAYNFRYVNELNLPDFIELIFCLVVSGFVLGALGARFVFPMISLESTAFWILRTAPIPTSKILVSKAWAAFIVLETLGLCMSASAGWALGFGFRSTLLSMILVTPIAVLAAILGVGLGGSYPRFNFENPMMIPMSYGGMIYVYWSMGTILLYCVILCWPLYVFYHPLALLTGFEMMLTIVLAIIGFAVPLVSGWIGFKMGCHRLSEAYES
jgi:ABC-2 type transport system permease protein